MPRYAITIVPLQYIIRAPRNAKVNNKIFTNTEKSKSELVFLNIILKVLLKSLIAFSRSVNHILCCWWVISSKNVGEHFLVAFYLYFILYLKTKRLISPKKNDLPYLHKLAQTVSWIPLEEE